MEKSTLTIDEQIKKLEFGIKFHYIFTPIASVFIVALSVILIIFTDEWKWSLCLILLPFSIWLSWYANVKTGKEEIKKLQEQKAEQEEKVEDEEQII